MKFNHTLSACLAAILLTLISASSFAQKSLYERIQSKLESKEIDFIKLTVTVFEGKKKLDGADVRFYRKGQGTALVSAEKSGRIQYNMELNTEYLVVAAKRGYVTKVVSFNTFIEDSFRIDVWPTYRFHIELFKGRDSLKNVSEPVIRLSMNNAINRYTPITFNYMALPEPEVVRGLVKEVVNDFVETQKEQEKIEETLLEVQRLEDEAKLKKAEEEAQRIKEEQLRLEAEAGALAEAKARRQVLKLKVEAEERSVAGAKAKKNWRLPKNWLKRNDSLINLSRSAV